MPGPEPNGGQAVHEAEGEPVCACVCRSRRVSTLQEQREERERAPTHQLLPTVACPKTTTHSATHALPGQPPILRPVALSHTFSSVTATGWTRKKTHVPCRSTNESVLYGAG